MVRACAVERIERAFSGRVRGDERRDLGRREAREAEARLAAACARVEELEREVEEAEREEAAATGASGEAQSER